MARWLASLAIGLLIVSLAGCTQAEPKAAPSTSATSAAPPTVSTETGAIDGLVLDDEELPIANVLVGLVETGAETKSDKSGRFTFSDLDPGSYNVVAERFGFSSNGRRVLVVAGEATNITIPMKPLESLEPFTEGPYVFNGYNQAGWSLLDILTNGQAVGCQKCEMQFNMSETVAQALFELSIKPTIPDPTGGPHMYVQAYLTDDGASLGATVANDQWSHGDAWLWDAETRLPGGEANFPGGQKARVLWANYCPVAWVCADQKFDVYYTFFHHAPGPANYTALPE